MINNFLAGKKKYSAFLLPILVAIVQAFQLDPETSKQIMDYLPTITALLSGIAFIIVEGINDQAKIVGSAATATAQASNGIAATTTTAPPIENSVAAQKQAATQSTASASDQAKPADDPRTAISFNAEEFDAKVEDRAKQSYLEANDITRYFAAADLGNTARWASLYHQLAYQDYMVAKAMKAFQAKFGYPYAEADKHLADDNKCPYYSVDNMARQKGIDFWFMLLMVRRTIAKAEELSRVG